MKINKLVLLLVAITLIAGCSNIIKFNLQNTITQKANDCNTGNCIITITQLTTFKWDKMYVFNTATEPNAISKAIGIDYPYYEEFTKSIVFLYKNKIIHYENNKDEIETATDGSIIFDYPDSLGYQMYTPNQAEFKFKKVEFSKGSYYKLYKQVRYPMLPQASRLW